MFKEETLFVVGAGASAEFGMPVGRELSDQIANLTYFEFRQFGDSNKGDQQLLAWMRHRYQDTKELNELLSAARHISEGIYLASSIDNFIDMHSAIPHLAEVGKLAIAVAISRAEARSTLFVGRDNALDRLNLAKKGVGNTWIDSFARILFDRVRAADVEKIAHNVTVVSFNYDRCLEQYLIEALSQTYRLDYSKAHEIVSTIRIIHPYGSLGRLPPRRLGGQHSDEVAFGSTIDVGLDPWGPAERLHTYTEQIEDSGMVSSIRDAMEAARNVIFLGFGFHPQNMDLIATPNRGEKKVVYATGLGVEQQEVPELQQRIIDSYAGKPTWSDTVHIEQSCSCRDLFSRHWRNLAAR